MAMVLESDDELNNYTLNDYSHTKKGHWQGVKKETRRLQTTFDHPEGICSSRLRTPAILFFECPEQT
jgi:hypothetical protein